MVAMQMPMDANRVAALVQLTLLTALTFKSSLGKGAAEQVLGVMPALRKLQARQLLPQARVVGARSQTQLRMAMHHQGNQLSQVLLQNCDAPGQILLLPR